MLLFGQNQAHASQKTSQNQNDLTKIYDKYGREMLITKEEWRKRVLPENIKRSWDNSDELYQHIVMALRDKHFPDVLEASKRLLEIDNNKERSYIIRSIVLKENGHLTDARAVLQDYINKYGETAYILTNLAKCYPDKGSEAKIEELLWMGLQLDPNQENGLGWWLAIHNEKGGEPAYINELKKVSTISGSWRAQLLLARASLKEKDLPSAMQYYKHVIDKAKDAPDVLMTISGDLGGAGYYNEIFTLVLLVYEPERHDVYVGLNILQAYMETKKFEEGKVFLKKMFSLNRPDIRKRLMFYSDKFEENLSNLPRKIEDKEKISIGAVPIDRPIFYYGLKGAEWLLPETKRDGPKIGFMPLANVSINSENEEVIQQEDEAGRLTRSIPLYVSETFFFETNSYIQVLIPVVIGGGMVTSGMEYDADYFLDVAAKSRDTQEFDFYIAGTVEESDKVFNVVLSIWDCKTKEKMRSFSRRRPKQEIGKAAKELANEVLSFMEHKKNFLKVKPVSYYKPMNGGLVGSQLLTYGQAFALVLVDNNYMAKTVITGERDMLRNPLDLALTAPNDLIPKLLFISNLSKAYSYHSEVYMEFKQNAIDLVNDNKQNEYITKLSPLVYKIFGMEKEFNGFEKTIQNYSQKYRDWFEKIKNIK